MRAMRAIMAACLLLASGCANPFGFDEASDLPLNTGTVVRVKLPNSTTFFGIVADDLNRSRYEPTNLPTAFQSDSLRIKFTGVYHSTILTIYDWGRAIELYTVEPL